MERVSQLGNALGKSELHRKYTSCILAFYT